MSAVFTDEQRAAIDRRQGRLLVDAGAGSGKTSVLVERFVRAVLEDGVDVGRILTITFTEKAAAELRERIRARLGELAGDQAARATDDAWISTIHGFCARVLRAHPVRAGLDPSFTVLEDDSARRLSGLAVDGALAAAALGPLGAELIAAHGPAALRQAVTSVHDELRARGMRLPSLPPISAPGELESARSAALAAARATARELGALVDPGVRVGQALDALARAEAVLADPGVWPGDLARVGLPGRNGAVALESAACDEYRRALAALVAAAAARLAVDVRHGLDELLRDYAVRYARLKAERSSVDFEDLELMARDLLAEPEIGGGFRERFQHVMVDEMQDTNAVQLELIDAVAGERLFMVGDAQQSIYGFRHADVELFEARGRELEAGGGRLSLQRNFRTRPDVLRILNAGFSEVIGEGFRPLVPGRSDPEDGAPRVELLIIDKAAEWDSDGLAAPWRLAEARVLAARMRELIAEGMCAAGESVVLTRATTDLRVYERALEDLGVPTYVIGGRGYWAHPQVVELMSYLRALANPRDEEALYGVFVSPLCGLSLDGLVAVAAGAPREELSPDDAARLAAFEAWFEPERAAAARLGVEQLIDRALERTGYDEFVLRLPGGRRRLANVRKLMRLGREFEVASGCDLRGFLDFAVARAGGSEGRESEAPVESEGLDAVRLMTIHRAKGLEFPVVCVADLGRGPAYGVELIRVGRDGKRLGLRLAQPGSAPRVNALDYDALGEEQREADAAEERRLLYVAMTRARERLVLSGALNWERPGTATPMAWIAPAFSDLPGVRVSRVSAAQDAGNSVALPREDSSEPRRPVPALAPPPSLPSSPVPVSSLSYSSLALYERCGYRFYVERILGLPSTALDSEPGSVPGLSATERGTLTHAALQELDFRHPHAPPGTRPEVTALVQAFVGSSTFARLAACRRVRREQRFAFALDGVLITGTFDAMAEERGRLLVVDYKTDRLAGRDPAAVVAAEYRTQQQVYALAALRAGADQVEVVHLFLEAPAQPVSVVHAAGEATGLEGALRERSAPLLSSQFSVTDQPHRGLCAGCPAAGGLCSWPLEVTTRPAVDRLF